MTKRKIAATIVMGTAVYWCSSTGLVALAQPAAPTAPSYPMQVSTQDQQSLRQICALAQKESSLTLEQSTGIGQYCLGLINRIGLALSPPPKQETPAAPPMPKVPPKMPPRTEHQK